MEANSSVSTLVDDVVLVHQFDPNTSNMTHLSSTSDDAEILTSLAPNVSASISINNVVLENESDQQEKSNTHINNTAQDAEKIRRLMPTLVNDVVLENNRYYCRSILEIVQFMAINELARRGKYNLTIFEECRGFFQNLFEFSMKTDNKLNDISKSIPQDANYTSPAIQNELIEAMVDEVRQTIVDEINSADVPFFTILEDGTKEKNDCENISIAVRYVKNGIAKESLLCIETGKKLDAETFTEFVINTLTEYGLNTKNILSQCYDGAFVISGIRDGVQARLQSKLERIIPYVHCPSHRLTHLLCKAVSAINSNRLYFDILSHLCNFFRKPTIAQLYEGQPIARRMAQKWSGHLKATVTVACNFAEIIKTLKEIKENTGINGDDVCEAEGLYVNLNNFQFIFTMVMMKKIFETILPADKALQSRGLAKAIPVIDTVLQQIKQLRCAKVYRVMLSSAATTTESISCGNDNDSLIRTRSFKSDILPTGQSSSSNEMESDFYQTLFVVVSEMTTRFGHNMELLKAVASAYELSLDKLQCLKTIGIELPSPEEIATAKNYIAEENPTAVLKILFDVRNAFPKTYAMLAAVETFACAAAPNGSSFSVLTRINRSQRQSMNYKIMANLIYLAIEKKVTEKVDFNAVMHKFNNRKERRIQLF